MQIAKECSDLLRSSFFFNHQNFDGKHTLWLLKTPFRTENASAKCACSHPPLQFHRHQQCSLWATVIKRSTGPTERLLHLRRQISLQMEMSTASLDTSQGHTASSSRLWLAIMQNVIQIHMLFDKIVSLGCLSHRSCFCFKLCFTPLSFLS